MGNLLDHGKVVRREACVPIGRAEDGSGNRRDDTCVSPKGHRLEGRKPVGIACDEGEGSRNCLCRMRGRADRAAQVLVHVVTEATDDVERLARRLQHVRIAARGTTRGKSRHVVDGFFQVGSDAWEPVVFPVNAQRDRCGDQSGRLELLLGDVLVSTGLPHGFREGLWICRHGCDAHRNSAQDVARACELVTRTCSGIALGWETIVREQRQR